MPQPPPLSLSRAALLKKCAQVIDGFDPKKTTVDAWVGDAEVLKDKAIGEVEHKFIHQVVYGCVRYQKFLKLFVTSFFYQSPTLAIRPEQTTYIILAYCLFFRLEELGVDEIQALIHSGAASLTALHAMMQYAMNVSELERWVKMEWCKLYDNVYIEEEVIGKLQSFADDLRPMLEDLELKATGTLTTSDGTIMKAPPKKLTKPMAPNITKPKPRLIPEPEALSREIKAKPVPEHIINGTSLAEVEQAKAQRREEERQKIATKYPAEILLETSKRRDANEIEDLTRKVEEERMKECTFKPAAAKPYVPPTEEATVRQNAAAVLREDALLKKKQAAEYHALKRYEEDLHDASAYHKWQHEMRLKDEQDEENRVQQRIVESQLAREEAIESFEGMKRRKHILAENQREEIREGLEVRDREQEADLKDKQKLVEQLQGDRDNALLEMQKVVEAKVKNAAELREEKKADRERKEKEDEHEMERRKDLIRQIRALERVPVERFKMFDPAEPPCHGLLEEMSLAELRERLCMEQTKYAAELEEKRERQLNKKHEKQIELTEKAETLAKIRDMSKQESQHRHQVFKAKKVEAEERQVKYREQCVVDAAAKIAQKKKDRHREEMGLKKELKEISTKKQFLAANAEMLEAKAHAAQQSGLEREAAARQRRTLIDQKRLNDIKMKDANVRRENRAETQEEYEKMKVAVSERIERAKADDDALKRSILKATMSAKTMHLKAGSVRGSPHFTERGYRERSLSRGRTAEMTQMSVSA